MFSLYIIRLFQEIVAFFSFLVYNKKVSNLLEENNMMIELAGLVIKLEAPGEYTINMCQDYLYTGEKEPDITIEYDQVAIDKEKELYPDAPEDYLQNICIYRQICKRIVKFGAMLIHSAAISVDGKGYLFTAHSGTGKTTHVNLWLNKFKDRALIINGDKPIVRETDGQFHVYGTPWCGKEGINTNTHVPIEGICILERGKENIIKKVSHSEAISELMGQTSRPPSTDGMVALLDVFDRLITSVPVYRLFCNMEPQAADVSYNGMCKK